MSDLIADAGLYACLYQPPPFAHGATLRFGAAGSRPTTNEPPSPRGFGEAGSAAFARGASARQPQEQRLTTIAAEFSPRYEQHRADLVSIDVRGLSRLLGTPKMIGAEMRRESASRGVRVHVAIAPTRMAAVVLSIARPGLTVVPAGGIADALAPIPLTVLEQLHEEPQPGDGSATQARLRAEEACAAIAALKRWGLRTLGELAALPAADLSARLGRGGRVWQAIARGEDTRPLVPMQAEERFEGTLELDWPIEGAEPLSFVLTRLLEPLSTRLERRDRGAAVLHVVLGLVTREVHACRLELPSPLRDVRALRTLALLDFESRPPSAAIDKVTVIIEPTPGRILQHALFSRPHPTPEQLSTLLARLGALMGQDRIGAPSTVDSFRPGAFAMKPFATSICNSEGRSASDLQPLVSVLRRCRQPIPARVSTDAHQRPLRVSTERRGFAGGAVLSCAGPWRTSGAWWEDGGNQKPEVTSHRSQVTSRKAEAGNEMLEVGNEPVSPKRDSNRSSRDGELVSPKHERSAQREGGPASPERHQSHDRAKAWSRDEWDVALADGAVYRIFRDRMTDAWFIDGVVD